MSLGVPMKFKLKSDSYIGLPIMFISLGEFVAPSGVMTTLSISLTNEIKGAIGNRAIGSGGSTRNGGTIGGGNVGASLVCRFHCPHLT